MSPDSPAPPDSLLLQDRMELGEVSRNINDDRRQKTVPRTRVAELWNLVRVKFIQKVCVSSLLMSVIVLIILKDVEL